MLHLVLTRGVINYGTNGQFIIVPSQLDDNDILLYSNIIL